MVRAAPRRRDPPGSRELARYEASAGFLFGHVRLHRRGSSSRGPRNFTGEATEVPKRPEVRPSWLRGSSPLSLPLPTPSRFSPPSFSPAPPQALRVAVPTSRAVGRQPCARDCSRHAGWTSVRPGQRDPEGIRPRDPQILHFGIWMILSRRPLRIDRGGKKPARSLSAGRRREVREMRLPSAPSPGALQGHGQDGKSASRPSLTQQPWSPFSCP